MTEDVIVDENVIDGLKELLGDAYLSLVDTFLNDAVTRIDNLNTAIESGQLDQIIGEAHALKGSSRNLGAMAMSKVCERIEHGGRHGESDSFQQDFTAVQQEFAAVREYFEAAK